MTSEHGLPIVRACRVARLSRAAYYKPEVEGMARDAELIAARLPLESQADMAGVLPASIEPAATHSAACTEAGASAVGG